MPRATHETTIVYTKEEVMTILREHGIDKMGVKAHCVAGRMWQTDDGGFTVIWSESYDDNAGSGPHER